MLFHYIATRCLSYNICSAWFLGIRISTCFLVLYYIEGVDGTYKHGYSGKLRGTGGTSFTSSQPQGIQKTLCSNIN